MPSKHRNSPEVDRRYDTSEKGRARKRRYNRSPKGRAAYARYEHSDKAKVRTQRYRDSVIVVQTAGVDTVYHVPAEKKEELRERLATFRQEQREEFRDARIG